MKSTSNGGASSNVASGVIAGARSGTTGARFSAMVNALTSGARAKTSSGPARSSSSKPGNTTMPIVVNAHAPRLRRAGRAESGVGLGHAMPVYEFGVELTVGDNTAFTVRGALRGLGYAELDRVERSELLRLRLPDGGLTIDDCGAALTHAEVVFNPNKHRLVRASAPDTNIYEAIVADVDDDSTALSELLRDRFGVNGLESIERATAWRLYERDGKPAG